jgi:hypothetical protein
MRWGSEESAEVASPVRRWEGKDPSGHVFICYARTSRLALALLRSRKVRMVSAIPLLDAVRVLVDRAPSRETR